MEGLYINNSYYTSNQILELVNNSLGDFPEYLQKVFLFLSKWYDDNEYIIVKTSGSTGIPKEIKLSKNCMKASAKSTINYFDLKEGNKLLLAMSADYIAGKMMVLRALYGGLNLYVYEPISDIGCYLDKDYDFCALVPFQVKSTLKNVENKDRFNRIKVLIIGGGDVDSNLKNMLSMTTVSCFSTYGMTETASHVALKKITFDKNDNCFNALPNISFSKDERECLIINSEHLSESKIITNDIVDLIDERSFIWKGRFDNVINSGGVKLHPEEMEKRIEHLLENRFFFTKISDDLLGEALVLVIESSGFDLNKESSLLNSISFLLNKYEMPKKIVYKNQFETTDTGKIKREL